MHVHPFEQSAIRPPHPGIQGHNNLWTHQRLRHTGRIDQDVFRQSKRLPSICGSWSIKSLLAAAVSSLDFRMLDGVQDGNMAMEGYYEALQQETAPARRDEIRRQLEAYCRLDTYAMLRLWHLFTGRRGERPQNPRS
jgi:hypothetical protein